MKKLKKLIALALCAVIISGCSAPSGGDTPAATTAKQASDNNANNAGEQTAVLPAAVNDTPQSPAAASSAAGTSQTTVDGVSYAGKSVYTYVPSTGNLFVTGGENGSNVTAIYLTLPDSAFYIGSPCGIEMFMSGYSLLTFVAVIDGKSDSVATVYNHESFENFSVTYNEFTELQSAKLTISFDVSCPNIGKKMHVESQADCIYQTHDEVGIHEYVCDVCKKNPGVCTICNGTGLSAGKIGDNPINCPGCGGTRMCRYCNGTGKVYQ